MTEKDAAGRPLKEFSGFMGFLGAYLTNWGPGYATIRIDLSDLHQNGIEVVHGGVMASLIDTAGAHAGIFCKEPGRTRKALTISINVNLVGNVNDGSLIADARLRKAGKTIFFSACEVKDEKGNLLATGEIIGRYGRGSDRPEGVEVTNNS